jgi:hypothetical protein
MKLYGVPSPIIKQKISSQNHNIYILADRGKWKIERGKLRVERGKLKVERGKLIIAIRTQGQIGKYALMLRLGLI